jgi:hypothetical protein
MLKKEDVVNNNDDDDEVRSNAPQNLVTATLCIEKFFLRTKSIYCSPVMSAES